WACPDGAVNVTHRPRASRAFSKATLLAKASSKPPQRPPPAAATQPATADSTAERATTRISEPVAARILNTGMGGPPEALATGLGHGGEALMMRKVPTIGGPGSRSARETDLDAGTISPAADTPRRSAAPVPAPHRRRNGGGRPCRQVPPTTRTQRPVYRRPRAGAPRPPARSRPTTACPRGVRAARG